MNDALPMPLKIAAYSLFALVTACQQPYITDAPTLKSYTAQQQARIAQAARYPECHPLLEFAKDCEVLRDEIRAR
jgi:hypothetical protein